MQGSPYRLEVFNTGLKGWGLRSWDVIPAGAFVIEYTGQIRPAAPCSSVMANQEMSNAAGYHDTAGKDAAADEYTFDLVPRPYGPKGKRNSKKLPLLPPEPQW